MLGTLEHNLSDARGCVSSEADLHYLTTRCSTCFSAAWILSRFDSLSVMHLSSIPLSQEVQAGPAKKVYMSQCPGHQPGPAEPRFCPQRQRCQPGWAHPALPELLWSVSLLHMFPNFAVRLPSLSQPGYINEMREGKEGIRGEGNQQRGGSERDKGQSHTIKLCSVGLQRPASYFHVALN